MGWMDGAVNGMMSRLIPAGFTPDEAFCLAQAAYIKEGKRAQGVPEAIVSRQDATWEINQTLKRLGRFPMGLEAHLQRIALWETVFGPFPADADEEAAAPVRSAADPMGRPGMGTARSGHTATLLPNGKVLVTGGKNDDVLSAAELYDTAPGQWHEAASMHTARTSHTATLLPDGTVLVVGGKDGAYAPLASAERYDPRTGLWTAAADMDYARESHTATLFPDGTLLAAGGYTAYGTSDTAEIFDPATGEWSATGNMQHARINHSATLLANGAVLVCGGINSGVNGEFWLDSAELYDPSAGIWSTAATMHEDRSCHTATLLAGGDVLVVGGGGHGAELYDPGSGTWSTTGPMGASRTGHSATLLPDGTVLVIGGTVPGTLGQPDSDYGPGSAEIYHPGTGEWTPAAAIPALRLDHTATLLPDGTVMVCGGYNWRDHIAGVEFWA